MTKPLACVECGSAAIVRPMGLMGFMVIPRRVSACELHKNPKRYCGGSVSAFCRSGICTTRAEAIDQWNGMQERSVSAI